MTLRFHATTLRTAQWICDGATGIDASWSDRFAHVFVFDTLAQAKAFVATYPGNFSDTGPAIFEIEADGLSFEADPQRPALAGASRTSAVIESTRLLALHTRADDSWIRWPLVG